MSAWMTARQVLLEWEGIATMYWRPINCSSEQHSNNDHGYAEQLKANLSIIMGHSIKKKKITRRRVCDDHCIFLNFILHFIYLFIQFWLCWVFVSVHGLSLVAASGGHSSSRFAGLSLSRPLLLQSTGSRRAGSVVVAHGPSCSAACGILPDQGSNPCPLHWQADSQPLRHQGSPIAVF